MREAAYSSAVADERKPDRDREVVLDQIRATYAGYERAGRHQLWDRSNAGYGRLAMDIQRRVVADIRRSLPGAHSAILDLGCGTGELYAAVREAGIPVAWTGLDLRPDAVAIATEQYPDAAFRVASADAIPSSDASYDVVVAQVLFSSLPSADLERDVVGEVRRVLKPGGWLVWSDVRYSNPANKSVHGISSRALSRLFGGWRIEVVSAGLLPPLARRLGLLSHALYPPLSAFPPLRSHLVGRLQPPKAR